MKDKGSKHPKSSMRPNPQSPPGLEVDSKGRPILVSQRLAEDRQKTHRASRRKRPPES